MIREITPQQQMIAYAESIVVACNAFLRSDQKGIINLSEDQITETNRILKEMDSDIWSLLEDLGLMEED